MLKYTYRKCGPSLLLFIHGLGANRKCFNEAIHARELNEYSLLIPDLPGFGESPSETENPTLDSATRELARLCNDQSYANLSIIAHSMGGAIGIKLAEILPVECFVNVVGNLVPSDTDLFSRRIAAQSLALFKSQGFEKFKELISRAQPLNRPHTSYRAALDDTTAEIMHSYSSDLVRISDNEDLLGRFIRLKCAKLFIFDEDNPVANEIKKESSFEKVCVPRTGHAVMEHNPKDFYRIVAEFISRKRASVS